MRERWEGLSLLAAARYALLVLLAAAAVAAGSVTPASADPAAVSRAKAEATALRSRIDALNDEVEISIEEYDKAADDLSRLDASIKANSAKLEVAQRDLKTARRRLDARLVGVYKTRGSGTAVALISAPSLRSFINRLALLSRVSADDGRLLTQVRAYRAVVAAQEVRLERERRDQRELVAQASKAKSQVQVRLAERQRALIGKQREVAQLEREEAARQARIAAEARARAEAEARAANQAARTTRRAAALPTTVSGGGVGIRTVPGSGQGARAVQIAARYLGVPYVWGGESPSGFDCSGLTQYVFAEVGVSLPRVAREQQRVGTPVSRDQLQPGDLVFFGSPAHHVGIYAGNDTMINAPYTGTVVRYDSINRRHYSGARRVL